MGEQLATVLLAIIALVLIVYAVGWTGLLIWTALGAVLAPFIGRFIK